MLLLIIQIGRKNLNYKSETTKNDKFQQKETCRFSLICNNVNVQNKNLFCSG